MACSGDHAVVGVGSYERLKLRAEHEQRSEASIVQSFRLDPAAPDGARWRWIASSRKRISVRDPESGEQLRAIEIQGAEGCSVAIEGPFEAHSFNRVAVTLAPASSPILGVRAELVDGPDIGSRSVRPDGGSELVTLAFDLPALRQFDRAGRRVVIESLSPASRFAVLRVDLVHVPWEEWLPAPEEAAELVEVGGVERRARGLATTSPLVATWEARPAQELVFSCGLPQDFRREEDRPFVRVTLRGARGASLARELELELGIEQPSAWRYAAIDLARFAGERVEARFELVSPLEGVGLAALGEPALARRSREAPALVLITSDTHRGDHLGVAPGGAGVQTPFLDSLAARGVHFVDCISPANVTRPSHASLLTGVSPRDSGVVTNEARLSDEAPTLAEAFRGAGWVTLAAVSISPMSHRHSGLGQGFDRMSTPTVPQQDSLHTIRALRSWLPEVEGLPVFVWLHVFDAHTPYDCGSGYEHLYYDRGRDPRDAALPGPPEHAVPDWSNGVRDLEYLVASYKAEISYLDGRLRELFVEPRLRSATVAFTADHGESLTAHGVYFDHRELYPDTLRVPLILAGPGVPAGLLVDRAVQNLDVGRTLLDLAGLAAVEFPGEDLLDVAPESGEVPRFAMSANAYSAAVQAGRWFAVLHIRNRPEHGREGVARRPLHDFELYDLEADPGCKRDLASEQHEQAGKVRRLLVDWLVGASKQPWLASAAAPDPEVVAQLAELGFATDDEGPEPSSAWFDPECRCEECRPFE